MALLAALGLAWQQRERLLASVQPAPQLTVISPNHDEPAAEAQPAADAAAPRVRSKLPPGALRKCVNGQQVSYTNVECPPGHQEQALNGKPVNVMPATPVSKPVVASSAPSALHQALGLTRDDTLRDRAIERAINANR